MSIYEYYKRQSKIKKPLLILYAIFMLGCIIASIACSIIYHFTIGDWLFILYVFLMLLGWGYFWFELEPTEEELAAQRQEMKELLEKWDREHNIKRDDSDNP